MTRKSTFVLLLTVLMMLSVVCAPTLAVSESSAAINPADVKVGLVLTGALGDQSVSDQAFEGMKFVEANYGVQVKTVECSDTSQYTDAAQRLCDEGYNLIIFNAFNQEEALRTLAPAYPEVSFLILDTVVELDNAACATYATHEVSFLAGVLSARKSESGVVGFIGGMDIPTIQKYQKGFEEGVAYVNPDGKVIAKYVGNDNSAWSNPAQAKSLTLDEIANGADVCFHAAGGSGLGMIEACNEKGVFSIGVNTDQAHLAPETVLSSALTRGDVAIQQFVKSYLDGDVMKGHVTLDCVNGGVGLVESGFFTDEDKAAIEEVTQKIISGEIKVTNIMDY